MKRAGQYWMVELLNQSIAWAQIGIERAQDDDERARYRADLGVLLGHRARAANAENQNRRRIKP